MYPDIKWAGKTVPQDTHLPLSLSLHLHLLKNMAQQRRKMKKGSWTRGYRQWARTKQAEREASDWKHFQGCFCWRVRCPCCSLKMLLDDKLKRLKFRTKAGRDERSNWLDVIRVSHSCLHVRDDETTTYSPTWPSC